MIRCTFHLNGGALSTLGCPGIGFFAAYSGQAGSTRNNPDAMAVKNIGPLPPGKYYIVSRPTGGRFSGIRDYFGSVVSGSDRELWFGLFRDDGSVDDYTFIEDVKRSNFRLHPAGYKGTSHGCITFPGLSQYMILRNSLLSTTTFNVTSTLIAYGTVYVY